MTNNPEWPAKTKDQFPLTVKMEFSVIAEIGKSADGGIELQDIRLPGIWIGDFLLPLGRFTDENGNSIIDILKENHRHSNEVYTLAIEEMKKHVALKEILGR